DGLITREEIMQGNSSPSWPSLHPCNIDVPETSLFFTLSVTAARFPDKTAFVDGQVSLTYNQLLAATEKLAGCLQKSLNVQKGDRVLLYMQNSLQYVIAFYAILRANAVVVPLNPMNKTAELKHYIEDSGGLAVITTQDEFPNIKPWIEQGYLSHAIIGLYDDSQVVPGNSMPQRARVGFDIPGCTLWCDAMNTHQKPDEVDVESTDLAVLIYTSGTTGKPKGCMHTHRSIMSGIINSVCWHKLGHIGNLLATVPMFHVTGMQTNMNVPIYLGNTVILLRRWNASAAVALIKQYKITEWTAIATMIVDLLAVGKAGTRALSELRYLRGGGAPMPKGVAHRLHDVYGLKYIEGYGLTETMAAVLFNPPEHPKAQCGGLPMFNTAAFIADPASVEGLPQGEIGEILVSGDKLFSGY